MLLRKIREAQGDLYYIGSSLRIAVSLSRGGETGERNSPPNPSQEVIVLFVQASQYGFVAASKALHFLIQGVAEVVKKERGLRSLSPPTPTLLSMASLNPDNESRGPFSYRLGVAFSVKKLY